jgi:membrane-associated phospholipid phosphatase
VSGDRHDFLVVNEWARDTSWLHGTVVAYAAKGVVLFAVLLLAGYLLARASGRLLLVARSILAGVGVLLAVALNQPIVHGVAERRPYAALPHVLVLVHRSADASFPSDHATMAGAVAAGLLFVNRRLGIAAVVAALAMAFARVYVGAHYPVDVVAGLAFGALVAVLTQIAAPLVTRLLVRLQQTPLQPLLAPQRASVR